MSDTVETAAPPLRRPRLRPRRRLLGVLALALVVAAVVVTVVLALAGGGSGGGNAQSSGTSLATVTRRPLSSQTQEQGTLGYSGSSTVSAPAGVSQAEVRQAQQSYESAEATVAAEEATLAADEQALAQARDRQSASSAAQKVEADKAQLASARAQLAGARQNLEATESKATGREATAVYTMLPSAAKVIRRGEPVYAVDGQPVLLLYGSVTVWRAFRAGMSSGRDVAALNANLRALGYDRSLEGDEFTAATAVAIRKLQAARGLPETGELTLGSVLFKSGPVRVKSVNATLGSTVQPGPVMTISSTRHQVSVALDASVQSEVKVGDRVTITLPDTSTTPGVVTSVGSVATAGGQDQTPTVDVTIKLLDEHAAGRLDGAPVQVSITTATVKGALTVPVTALLALAGGGYALEVVDPSGAHRLVPVTLGLFDDADGVVQVSGAGVQPGQRIVVPGS